MNPYAFNPYGVPAMLPPPPLFDDEPDVPALPEDRLDHAMYEFGVGITKRVSDSPMLDDKRASAYERRYGMVAPSPRNLHERGTASSDSKSMRGRDKSAAKKNYYRGSGERHIVRDVETPVPMNASLNKKLSKKVSTVRPIDHRYHDPCPHSQHPPREPPPHSWLFWSQLSVY